MAAVETVCGRRGAWRIDVTEDGGSVVLAVVYVDLRGIDQPVHAPDNVENRPGLVTFDLQERARDVAADRGDS
jgi:hypothetical protein